MILSSLLVASVVEPATVLATVGDPTAPFGDPTALLALLGDPAALVAALDPATAGALASVILREGGGVDVDVDFSAGNVVSSAATAFVLVFTIIGILVAVPLGILTSLVWAVASAIAFLAIADRLVCREDGWLEPLLVGAAINGLLTLRGIGGILSFGVGAVGFGAVLENRMR